MLKRENKWRDIHYALWGEDCLDLCRITNRGQPIASFPTAVHTTSGRGVTLDAF